MDALDQALRAHASSGGDVDPLDAALAAHAASGQAPAAAPTQPPRQTVSYPRVFANGVAKGVAAIGDMLPSAAVNLANLGIAGYGVGKRVLTGSSDLPEPLPGDILSGWNKMGRAVGLIADEAEPSDATGRVVDMTGQVIGGGGVNPRTLARAITTGRLGPAAQNVVAATASGLGAGAGSEAVRDVNTGSPAVDAAIRAGATLGGGAAAGGIAASRSSVGSRINSATVGVTPQQLAQARALQDRAAAAGSPITGYEAIQAVTGPNPKMQTQQRIAEQSDAAGRYGLTAMMQGRPNANAQVFNAAADSIAPASPLPDTLAGRMQASAQQAIDHARAQGNAQAAPFYARSSNDPALKIPASDWNAIASDPAVAWALDQTKRSPLLGVQGAAEGSVQWLDAAKKFLDSKSQSAMQAGDRYPAGQAGQAATRIAAAIDAVVPDYAKARSIYASNMQANVVPMEQSQVGKLARSDAFNQQAETLLPNKPMDVTPQVVDRTVGTLNAQDPNIVRQFVAQYLRGQFNEASQQGTNGPNVMGAARFAAQVAGNPAQERNLVAALTASGATPDQMMTALQIFRAQGMKPPVNSATTANAAEGAALGGGVGTFLRNPISNTFGLVDNWRNGSSARDLARILSAPDSVQRIQDNARIGSGITPTQQQMLASLLAATRPPAEPSP